VSNFVLVHGAWQSAWSWRRVIEQMEAARGRPEHDINEVPGVGSKGQIQGPPHISTSIGQVLALDLPGHGQRFANEIRRITMGHYIHAVATLAQVERLEDVVLVGHGFAATFLPQVSLELGDRVKRVVFIAGDLPPEGKTAYDRLSRWDKVMLRAFKAGEKGFRFPDFVFKGILCNDLDANSARETLSRLVPEPFLPWLTPVSRQGFLGRFPTTYVILTRDKVIPLSLQRRYSQSLGSPDVEELDAGHGALLSHPREVAGVLLKYA